MVAIMRELIKDWCYILFLFNLPHAPKFQCLVPIKSNTCALLAYRVHPKSTKDSSQRIRMIKCTIDFIDLTSECSCVDGVVAACIVKCESPTLHYFLFILEYNSKPETGVVVPLSDRGQPVVVVGARGRAPRVRKTPS